jgi:hypothetical protein
VYGEYVRAVAAVADDLGTTPEQIERFLFRRAPSPKEMSSINRSWKNTKARRLKARAALATDAAAEEL